MLQRIRLALQDRGSTDSFGGEVEADETFIGPTTWRKDKRRSFPRVELEQVRLL